MEVLKHLITPRDKSTGAVEISDPRPQSNVVEASTVACRRPHVSVVEYTTVASLHPHGRVVEASAVEDPHILMRVSVPESISMFTNQMSR